MFQKFGKEMIPVSLEEAVKKVMDEDEIGESGLRMAAHAAHKAGKSHFNFQGKSYPVNVKEAEAEGTTKKYEMMHRNGQVKRFVAKDDADAKRIAAGHGAKSVIRMKGNVPGDKIGEQGVAEAAEPNYKSSAKYRGKVADFRPKSTDVGQGRKITGKLGKYGKQPDDDNMVEPPKDHTVGAVKTDPSTVVPGHSTMAAKLHLASLPKDKEGNPIIKGARKVSAADLVAKRKAMMAGQKNEEVESLDEVEDTLHPAGAALLKHIKPQHHNLYKPHLTKDVFNGSYGDRTSVLKAAKDAGHLKMDLKKQNEEVENIEEGGEKYKVKSTGHDTKGSYYISPSTNKKVYKSGVEKGDHEVPGTGEIKKKMAPPKQEMKEAKKQPLSAYERLKKNMKKKGYDLDAREKFWTDKLKQMDAQKKESVEFPFAKSLIEKTEKEMKEKKDVVMPEEGEMSASQKSRREKFVMAMKDKTPEFKAKYGKRWKEVMYATATKMAMKEEIEIDEKLDPKVKTTDTLKGRESGGKDNEHSSFKVKLEDEDGEKTKATLKKTKEMAKNAFKRVKNETMMGKISN